MRIRPNRQKNSAGKLGNSEKHVEEDLNIFVARVVSLGLH